MDAGRFKKDLMQGKDKVRRFVRAIKQGSMKITNVNEIIMEVFEVTGFSVILTIV